MLWARTKIVENYYDHPLLFQMGISLLNSKVQEEWSAYFYCFVFDLPNFYSGEIFQPQHWTSIHDVDCPLASRPVKFKMYYLVSYISFLCHFHVHLQHNVCKICWNNIIHSALFTQLYKLPYSYNYIVIWLTRLMHIFSITDCQNLI